MQLDQASEIAKDIERQESHSGRLRAVVGLGFIAAAGAAVWAGHALEDSRFTQEMPFNESAQAFVNNIDNGLGLAGEIALPASMLMIGGVKLGAMRNNRLRSIDKRSSQELTDDGHAKASMARRGLRSVAAGSMPVVVAASAAVGALTTGIGTEITDGPSRPISAFGDFAPGDTMITQFQGAMPMLESKLSQDLTDDIKLAAEAKGVTATSFQLGLNSIEQGSNSYTGLTLGIESDHLPAELQTDSCGESIPVLADKSAHFENGTHLKINGVDVTVVGETEGTSAINRIGIVMDQAALEYCVNKDTEIASHGVILDTTSEQAQEILDIANTSDEAATVISTEEYKENSKDFWESNVKPITNTLALVGLMTTFIAMGGNAVSRMLRNRRELAAKLAARESVNQFRVTELVRGAKDGVLGSTVGVGLAAALTVPVNALESGMRVGLGVHEAAVAYAVGILGSVGGTLVHVLRPKKTVDRSEHTRV